MQDLRHVLLLEDSPPLRRLFGAYLEEFGFEVIAASSVGEATRLLETCPSLVAALLDYELPDGKGPQIARLLRERFGQNIQIVSVSGKMGSDARWDLEERKLYDRILSKPCLANDLEQAIATPRSP